jgi:hypothetical protein
LLNTMPQGGCVASLRVAAGDVRDERIAKWEPDPRSSNGGRPNPASYSVRFDGISAILSRCAMLSELPEERGLDVDHTTVWRRVQYYGPEMEQRLRRHLKPTNKPWRVDETYVRVKCRWCYLYRAIDSTGATIDFLLRLAPSPVLRGLAPPACTNLPRIKLKSNVRKIDYVIAENAVPYLC